MRLRTSEVTIIYDYLDSERIYSEVDNLRIERGLTIYALAKRAGVCPGSIYKWRDNKSTPTPFLLESICEVLEIEPYYLIVSNENLKRLIKAYNKSSTNKQLRLLEIAESDKEY